MVVASSRNYFLSLIGKMLIAYTNRSIAMGVLPLYRTPGPKEPLEPLDEFFLLL